MLYSSFLPHDPGLRGRKVLQSLGQASRKTAGDYLAAIMRSLCMAAE